MSCQSLNVNKHHDWFCPTLIDLVSFHLANLIHDIQQHKNNRVRQPLIHKVIWIATIRNYFTPPTPRPLLPIVAAVLKITNRVSQTLHFIPANAILWLSGPHYIHIMADLSLI